MSNSCPWLPNRVRERKGAKSTKISLSKGATFSSARSNLVVILWVGKQIQKETEKKVQLASKYRDQFKITLPFNFSWLVCGKVTTGLKSSYRNSTTGRQREQMLNLSPCYMHTSPISATALSYKLCEPALRLQLQHQGCKQIRVSVKGFMRKRNLRSEDKQGMPLWMTMSLLKWRAGRVDSVKFFVNINVDLKHVCFLWILNYQTHVTDTKSSPGVIQILKSAKYWKSEPIRAYLMFMLHSHHTWATVPAGCSKDFSFLCRNRHVKTTKMAAAGAFWLVYMGQLI